MAARDTRAAARHARSWGSTAVGTSRLNAASLAWERSRAYRTRGRARRSDMDDRSAKSGPQPILPALAARRLTRKHSVRPRPFVSASAGLSLGQKYKLWEVPRMRRAVAVLLLCCIASPAVF